MRARSKEEAQWRDGSKEDGVEFARPGESYGCQERDDE